MKFVLRNGNINDLNLIAEAHVRCFWESYQGLIPQPVLAEFTNAKALRKWRDEFIELKSDSDRALFIIENESGRITGFAHCGAAIPRENQIIGEGEIYELYIESDYQGYGLGKALMLASSRWLISRGLFSACLWSIEENGIGRKFCEDLGAKIMARRKIQSAGYSINFIGLGIADLSEVAQLEDEVPHWGES